ncbi:Hypothetical predicted protein [Cloeon dipterum]|uniref:Pre-rRNA-processing protein TSR2 homolog n=1 Tax=Cloeon dipterum TaxID=197152 RepID=A0A8S1DF51_9INSE|nr:Hypothetical predicted protein [Cloeon dipterum]
MDVKTAFKRTVELIFKNWTALQLAGVLSGVGNYKVLQLADYIAEQCFAKASIEEEEIEDTLTDILDSEFQTICEDGSPLEVSREVWRIHQLYKAGNIGQLNVEIQQLQSQQQENTVKVMPSEPSKSSDSESEAEDNNSSEPMETSDPADEWTVVRRGRKH